MWNFIIKNIDFCTLNKSKIYSVTEWTDQMLYVSYILWDLKYVRSLQK